MKQGKIIEAYKVLNKLAAIAMPSTTDDLKVYRLRMALRPVWDFQVEEENKLHEKLKPMPGENGGIAFDTEQHEKEFWARIKELGETEQEISIQPITLPVLKGTGLNAYDMEALDGFVTFEE